MIIFNSENLLCFLIEEDLRIERMHFCDKMKVGEIIQDT